MEWGAAYVTVEARESGKGSFGIYDEHGWSGTEDVATIYGGNMGTQVNRSC